MNSPALDQRCWNHEGREAVCRCPACGRPFCRECVSEHETRLLCAACLSTKARGRQKPRGRVSPAVLAAGGLLLAWLIFYGAGRTMMLITARMQEAAWEER